MRRAASENGYGLVINARVDVFLGPMLAGAGAGTQAESFPKRCGARTPTSRPASTGVYPIVLWETDALRGFMSEVGGPVNVVRLPQAPSLAEASPSWAWPG